MKYTSQQWIEEFARVGAFWSFNPNYTGEEKQPHALLRSGLHSRGFFNATRATEQPHLLRLMGENLALLLQEEGVDFKDVDRVVGPATGAITLAASIADAMNRLYFSPEQRQEPINVLSGFTEKDADGNQRVTRFDPSAEDVLICEDTLTTGGSSEQTARAVLATGEGEVFPFILCICNRSGSSHVNGRKIISLIQPVIETWPADSCLLCQQGSPTGSPKVWWNRFMKIGGGK